MRVLLCLLLALFAVQTPALAAEPVVAPVPDWVESVAIPAANPALADRPVQTLLVSGQSRYAADRYDHYAEMALLIQSPQGLQAAGTITIPWQPDQSELIVHKVRIIRGGQVIDLLANGQTFTVLRRENNLEMAMLDGVLTAVMQAEGLSVGDVLNVAFTQRRTPGSLGLRGENFIFAMHRFPARRMLVRQLWTDEAPMRWQGGDLFRDAQLRRTARGTELRFDRENVEGPEPPAGAPARFMLPARLELSGWTSWTELSRAFAPLYVRASALAADSPLRAQIERIAAASPDPRARALAALRLVQDEVRYLALAMGEGHLTPATADQTWTRRYGDCKGKTALLLALLHGLGIEAEPVVVSSGLGDAVRERLPLVGAFDHVIVRARIGGTSYWLDGTRSGDRSLDDLAGASFAWGLPLREAGAELEAIPAPLPAAPTFESEITYDASGGLAETVPMRIVLRWRGDGATAMRSAVAQVGRDTFVQQIRDNSDDYAPAGAEISGVDIADDSATGAWSMTIAGRAPMRWRRVPGHSIDEFKFDNATISWDPDTDRDEGPYRDAPFALGMPMHLVATETVILPARGRGFTLQATSFDRTIAGARISRDVRIVDGRAVSRTEFRRSQSEIAAAELRAAEPSLRDIVDDEAWLRAPEGTRLAHAAVPTPATVRGGESGSVEARDVNERGFQMMQHGDITGALAAFRRAAELAPRWSLPLANQAIALIHRGDYAAAESLLDRAATLDPEDAVVSQGRGMIHYRRGEPGPAIAQYSRSLALDPGDRFTLLERAAAYVQLDRIAEALADLDSILASDPANLNALSVKSRLLATQGRGDEAVALVDAALADDPGNFALLGTRAIALTLAGRTEDARQAYGRALEAIDRLPETQREAIPPQVRHELLASAGQVDRAIALIDEALARSIDNANLLNERCWLRATRTAELQRALADCDRALSFDPRAESYLDSRALVRLRLGDPEGAIRDADAALAIRPRLANSLFVRGVAKIRRGDRAGGEADLAAARRLQFDIEGMYRSYGVLADVGPTASAAAVD